MTGPDSRVAADAHLVAFVDLLGFAALIESDDGSARTKTQSLLEKLAGLRGDFELESRSAGGNMTTHVAPAVSSFSDCIVISFDLARLLEDEARFFLAWQMLGRWFGEIALEAIGIGCLLRGGLTIGPLYHKGGVVFGRGMVDAYKLESASARYPRIIVAQHVLERANAYPAYHETLFQAEDGEWCLDYLLAAYQVMSDGCVPLELSERRRVKKAWVERTLGALMGGILKYPPGSRAQQNWRWLHNRLLMSVAKLNPYEFGDDGNPVMFAG